VIRDESILAIEDEDKFDPGRHCSQDLNLEGKAKRALASASSSCRGITFSTNYLSPIIRLIVNTVSYRYKHPKNREVVI
jgi:hypothetical protein